jgi:hypothetical protein
MKSTTTGIGTGAYTTRRNTTIRYGRRTKNKRSFKERVASRRLELIIAPSQLEKEKRRHGSLRPPPLAKL